MLLTIKMSPMGRLGFGLRSPKGYKNKPTRSYCSLTPGVRLKPTPCSTVGHRIILLDRTGARLCHSETNSWSGFFFFCISFFWKTKERLRYLIHLTVLVTHKEALIIERSFLCSPLSAERLRSAAPAPLLLCCFSNVTSCHSWEKFRCLTGQLWPQILILTFYTAELHANEKWLVVGWTLILLLHS